MKVLLDTHILLWWLCDDARLSKAARVLIEKSSNEIFVSVASIWEIAIKSSLGKIRIDLSNWENNIADQGFEIIDIKSSHVLQIAKLPFHHKDPFDRVLISQCLVESKYLLTQDPVLQKYGKLILFTR